LLREGAVDSSTKQNEGSDIYKEIKETIIGWRTSVAKVEALYSKFSGRETIS
jgi:hypothetical protein